MNGLDLENGNLGGTFLQAQAIDDDDDDIVYLGEVVHSEEQEEPRSDALEILEYLASENDATINFEVTEHDSGELSLPLYFKCKLQAGSYNVETESPYSRMAKLMAAELCLDQMQRDHPEMRLPRWKKSAPLDPKLDPVLILKQFCRNKHLGAPCSSYSTCRNEDNGEVEYLYKYYWDSTYTEGRNKSKSVAQRLAAFEMLDYILTFGMNEMKGSTVVVDDHISLSPAIVKRIEDGQLKQECIPRTPQSFQTVSQPISGPSDPTVKIRHGFSPQASGVKEKLRFYTEFEATFVAKGKTEDEALQKCLAAAVFKAQEYGSQFERTAQPGQAVSRS